MASLLIGWNTSATSSIEKKIDRSSSRLQQSAPRRLYTLPPCLPALRRSSNSEERYLPASLLPTNPTRKRGNSQSIPRIRIFQPHQLHHLNVVRTVMNKPRRGWLRQ